MPREVLAFDVNETLLDLRALDAPFTAAFGDASLRPVWFQTMLQIAFVGGVTGEYIDFSSAQEAALSLIAGRVGKKLDAQQTEAILGGMRRLPAHQEVTSALRTLKDAGFRQVTLTNSPLGVVRAQLEYAGLADLFDDVLSADEVRRLKPAAAAYQLVGDRLGVPLTEVRLVAAHAWDVAGALAAGCKAAFVARPGAALYPSSPRPDIIGPDLTTIAQQLLA